MHNNGHVILTKNSFVLIVVLSIEEYSRITNSLEYILNETDYRAESDSKRLTHNEVFESL